MATNQEYVEKTEALVEPIAEKYNYELVDVEYVKEAGNWYLRVYLDKEGGITLDDLTKVNHELSDLLDTKDYMKDAYILEVSSPGLLRPFKKPRDFLRNIGEDVELKLYSPIKWEENGKTLSDKEFVGILKSYDEESESIVVSFETGKKKEKTIQELDIQVKDIALIRKFIDF